MRVHSNQINAYAQLDALRAAEKAAAKQEAARTRKKLSEFASKLAGEAEWGEDCGVRLGEREEAEEQGRRKNRGGRKKSEDEDGEGRGGNSISDWA
jgi:hypothetical protein